MNSILVGDVRIPLPNHEIAATWFRRYRALGFSPIHWTVDPANTTGEAGKDGKGPVVRGWNTMEFEEPPPCERQYHLGLKTGAEIMRDGEGTGRYLVCVDVDDVLMQTAIEANLPPTAMMGGKESTPKAHLFYSVDALPNSFKWNGMRSDGKDGCLLELMSVFGNSTCKQCMVAPSRHYKSAADVIWAKQEGEEIKFLEPHELQAPAEVSANQLYKCCTAALMLATGGSARLSEGKGLPILHVKKDPERALALTKASILAEDEDGRPRPSAFDKNEAKRIIDHAVWELEKVDKGNVQTAMNALVFTAASLLAGSAPREDAAKYLEELKERCLEVFDSVADRIDGQHLGKWEYTIDRAVQQGKESPRKRCMLQAYKCTDQGAADLLAAEWRGSYRCVISGKVSTWHCWNGSFWAPTSEAQLMRDTAAVFRWATAEALMSKDKEWGESAVKHYFKQERKERASAAVSLLKAWVGGNGLAVPSEAMDADPWIFNCANGTFDIKAGVLREYRRADLCTKASGFKYVKGAKPPEKLLNAMRKAFSVQRDGEDCVRYMMRWFGYLATGDISEQKLLVLHGGGQNGKTTLLKEIVCKVLGDYAGDVMKEVLLELDRKSGSSAAPEIVALRGQRFGLFSEIQANEFLNEARVKQLTGSCSVKTRALYGGAETVINTCKFIMDVNYMPKVKGSDFGILRRIYPVPYTRQLQDGEKVKGFAEDILATEGDALLTAILDEAHIYSKEGLGKTPDSVERERATFAQDNDVIQSFLDEVCELDMERRTWGCDEPEHDLTADGLLGTKHRKVELSKFTVGADELYQTYRTWSSDGGYQPLNVKNFKAKLMDKGWAQPRSSVARIWNGIRIRPPASALPQ